MKFLNVTKKDKILAPIMGVMSVLAIVLAVLLKTGVLNMNEDLFFSKNFSIWLLLMLGSVCLVLSIITFILACKIKK